MTIAFSFTTSGSGSVTSSVVGSCISVDEVVSSIVIASVVNSAYIDAGRIFNWRAQSFAMTVKLCII